MPVSSLEHLSCLTNLQELRLPSGTPSDLTALQHTKRLTQLALAGFDFELSTSPAIAGPTPGLNTYMLTHLELEVSGEFDAVVHLAGLSIVPESIKFPYGYYRTNIMGTETIVNQIKSNHILFASTSSAWEMASPYARSKVAAEDVIRQFSNNYTIFRFFT